MKKILNAPADYVDEMLDGLVAAHPVQGQECVGRTDRGTLARRRSWALAFVTSQEVAGRPMSAVRTALGSGPIDLLLAG